ncbi:GTPase [Anatilimnocola floriformis]|uniref:GTPase n=1 Tax=Anatilimnocola floriformis TaxID=2948575 RepID=UPI0020C2D80F|nr:GTPase [Anatilimnocola floriformis]
MESETTATLLTPPGRGALATIRVRGPQAWQITNACLTKPIELADSAVMRPWLREFRSAQGAGEELVVCFSSECEARIHCHGGTAACEAVLKALEEQGAQREQGTLAEPNADARNALAGALSEKTALILLDQLQGAWGKEIQTIIDLIQRSEHTDARARVEALLSRVPLGQHLTQPWQVVLAGRPNAGKSNLLNALLGFQRSITSPEPGTTRDVVTARTAFDGWPVELRDTAGLRTTTDAIEVAGVELAERELRAADLVLFLIPSTDSFSEAAVQLQTIRELRGDRPLIVVSTKSDLPTQTPIGNAIAVSAVSGVGLAELAAAIVHRLIGAPPQPDEAVPFLPEHAAALTNARDALDAGSPQLVLFSLNEIR